MPENAIIIPCFNEAKRLKTEVFINFLSQKEDVCLIFVDDGSKDRTSGILKEIRKEAEARVTIIQLPKNKGKATAIREGILTAASKNVFKSIGYLDADLSTDLDEYYALLLKMQKDSLDYIIGSRIKMLNTKIERSWFRHLAGRMLATLIDSRYRLGVYDTQCGAKCFSANLITEICKEPFKTKWFFDVEILLRIRKNHLSNHGVEQPLLKWKNPGGSKLNILKFPAIIKDLYLLYKNYSKK